MSAGPARVAARRPHSGAVTTTGSLGPNNVTGAAILASEAAVGSTSRMLAGALASAVSSESDRYSGLVMTSVEPAVADCRAAGTDVTVMT